MRNVQKIIRAVEGTDELVGQTVFTCISQLKKCGVDVHKLYQIENKIILNCKDSVGIFVIENNENGDGILLNSKIIDGVWWRSSK